MNTARIRITITLFALSLVIISFVVVQRSQANTKAQIAIGEVVLNSELVLPPQQLITLSDDSYGYAYQVPSDWSPFEADDNPGGRFTTYMNKVPDAETIDPTRAYLGMSFSASKASKMIPELENISPYFNDRSRATTEDVITYLPEGEIRTIGEFTVFTRTDRDPTFPSDGPAPYGTTVYFLVDSLVYHFWITYAPPANPEYEAEGWYAYNQVVNTIIYSFRVDKNSPYFIYQTKPSETDPIIERVGQEAELQQEEPPLPPTNTPSQGYPDLN